MTTDLSMRLVVFEAATPVDPTDGSESSDAAPAEFVVASTLYLYTYTP